MLNKFFDSIAQLPRPAQSREKPLEVGRSSADFLAGGVFTAVAAVHALFGGVGAPMGEQLMAVRVPPTTTPAPIAPEASVPQKEKGLPDGVYLYGQSSQPEQLGQAYMVFESRRGELIGAFYMPLSSFDCFYGTLEQQELALTVVNSYEQTTYSYAIGIEDYPIAASSENPPSDRMSLEGFQPIANVSENDRRILDTCKQIHQDQIWEQ